MNNIEFFFEDIEPFSGHNNHLQKCINKLIINELKQTGDISVIFCSDKYLFEMNKRYLKHNYFTDIITFDYVEKNIISGDLFISLERIKENAQELGIKVVKEIYRVVFHGVLHLVGYNDKTGEEKKIMTEREDFYLSEVDFSEIEL